MNCITDFFTYETTKSVVVKSWTIGIINRVVQLLIITYFIGWVFVHEKAYQVRDTAIESSVMTKVKGFGVYNDRIMDVADYVTPTQSELKFQCKSDDSCKDMIERQKPGGNGLMTGKCVPFNATLKTCEIKGWCPAEIDSIKMNPMMEVENFTIFIKNSIRFPLFNFTKGNFLPTITSDYIKKCNFNPVSDRYCPIFKVGDVLKFAHQNFSTLANKGGVIGIKIGWVCDLDKSEDECNPSYSFTRLDAVSEKNSVSPGYNFRYAKYYKMENGTEYRTLLKAYAIRFDVLVNGNAGKFDMIPTLINMVAAFTSVGVGTVLCDIILLNFLKGADQYKAKKFEEVSFTSCDLSETFFHNIQTSIKHDEKQSSDSGAFSMGQYG
uniref:P2X purinoceptor n=1 Tax=Denticeps clupeoides TaxID=299321 RepID=A0AAY4A4W3_9TELE